MGGMDGRHMNIGEEMFLLDYYCVHFSVDKFCHVSPRVVRMAFPLYHVPRTGTSIARSRVCDSSVPTLTALNAHGVERHFT